MERSTIFHGKIHYFDWVMFNSYVSHYQRVTTNKSPSGWWWCNVPILKKDGVKVNGKDDIPYMKWKKLFETTNQPFIACIIMYNPSYNQLELIAMAITVESSFVA